MEAGVLRKDNPDEAAQMPIGLCTFGYNEHVLYGVTVQDGSVENRQAEMAVKQCWRCYGR